VLFPFYGYQKTPEAERTAIALLGYIGESIKENRTEEKSILWPLANWHSSDIKSGSRIIPFYWYRNRNEGRDKISSLVTPLFLYNNTLDRKGTEDSYVLSPLWFRFYSRVKDESQDKHFALPFYYFQKSQTKYENKNLFVSLPFIYYGVSDTHSKSLYNRNFWMIPLLALYNSDNYITNWNFALIVNSVETKENSNFLLFPFYYHDIDSDKEKPTSLTRWILPGYYKKNYAKTSTDWAFDKLTVKTGLYEEITANKTTTKELCIEDVCVSKNELKALLDNAHINSIPTINSINQNSTNIINQNNNLNTVSTTSIETINQTSSSTPVVEQNTSNTNTNSSNINTTQNTSNTSEVSNTNPTSIQTSQVSEQSQTTSTISSTPSITETNTSSSPSINTPAQDTGSAVSSTPDSTQSSTPSSGDSGSGVNSGN
jgi:hypothetical protein